jgi:divalent metal cation (Fe/Co/Zn/Cd) transporter
MSGGMVRREGWSARPQERAVPQPVQSDEHRNHVRAGARVSVASIIWTACSSTASIAIGIASGSLALLTFGLVGVLDAAGSASLVVHFRHALRHDALSERHERIALRIATTVLIVVGGYGFIEGSHRLFAGEPSDPSVAGIIVAAVSAVALCGLFFRKRHVAGNIPSPALHADAWLSATGASLAVVTLAGTVASAGWWRTDPIAAAIIGVAAIGVGVAHARG